MMTAAALLIPLATFWFNFFSKRNSGAGQVGQGILLTSLYWLIAAVFWNGVSNGVWPDAWLIWGAPIAFGATTVVLFMLFHWRALRLALRHIV